MLPADPPRGGIAALSSHARLPLNERGTTSSGAARLIDSDFHTPSFPPVKEKETKVTQGFPGVSIELESSCQQQQPPPKVCWRRVSSLYPKSDTPPIEDQKSGNRSRSLMGVLPLEIIADLHRHCQDMVLVVALGQESPHGRN